MLSLALFKEKRFSILIAVLIVLLSLLIIFGSVTSTTKSLKKTADTSVPSQDTQTTGNTTDFSDYDLSLKQTQNTSAFLSPTISNPSDNKPIAKVGNEIIYQKDLETELKYYPRQDDSAKKLLLNKIVSDSKIIQIAQEEGLINPDNSIYNSPTKDYLKRVDIVRNAKTILKENVFGIKGVIISIWFLNDHVGPLGYEKAKQIAFEKISQLHQAVKSGQITIREAERRIRNDSSLAQLDPTSYKENASFDFSVYKGQKITYEKEFDDILWQTEEGGVTDVFLGQSFDFDRGGVRVPAYYMFGQVSQKSKVVTASLEDYITQKGQKYEVSYF